MTGCFALLVLFFFVPQVAQSVRGRFPREPLVAFENNYGVDIEYLVMVANESRIHLGRIGDAKVVHFPLN